MKAIDPREVEERLLQKAVDVSRGLGSISTIEEANVLYLASSVILSDYPAESKRLRVACEQHFKQHPEHRVELAEPFRRGWVSSLPRLKDMLQMKLRSVPGKNKPGF
jgi:hypothetical protein